MTEERNINPDADYWKERLDEHRKLLLVAQSKVEYLTDWSEGAKERVETLEQRVRDLEAALTETVGALQALKDSKAIQFTFCDGDRQSDMTHPYVAANHALRVLANTQAALGGAGEDS